MPTSPSLNWLDHLTGSPQRIARAAIMNGMDVPPRVAAQLEARGISVGELETRIRQNMEFVR